MGRPSKLTPAQWEEITQRAAKGESISALAREFKISRPQVSDRVSDSRRQVKSIVSQIVELPISLQRVVSTLVEVEAAKRQNAEIVGTGGLAIAARLTVLAQGKMDAMTKLPAAEDLRDVAAAAQVINSTAAVGLAQLNAVKGTAPHGPDTTEAKDRLRAMVERRKALSGGDREG